MTAEDQYNELSAYTLSLGDDDFLHQHVVDAWTAQMADEHTKPITIVFALAGLYLHIERGYNGRQVQQAHMQMARNKDKINPIVIPAHRGNITVSDVLATAPGEERRSAIHQWCASIWEAYFPVHDDVRLLTGMMLAR